MLKTQRLTLRPQQPGDAAALFQVLNDAEAMRFWSRPPIARLAVVEELVREQQAGECARHRPIHIPLSRVDLPLAFHNRIGQMPNTEQPLSFVQEAPRDAFIRP